MRLHPSSVARFVEPAHREHPARWAIVASWNRCSNVAAHVATGWHRIPDADLEARLERCSALVALAVPGLKALLGALPRSRAAYLTDGDGIVLVSFGSEGRLRELGLVPGIDRSESRIGTNAAGTCLAAGRPMVVAGKEHLAAALQDCACSAAPIHDRDGRIAGVLGVASSLAHARDQRIARVTEAALGIEATLRSS